MNAGLPRTYLREEGHPSWLWMVGFSLLLHGVACLAIWGFERYASRRPHTPMAISVRLVGASSVQRPSVAKSSPEEKNTSAKSRRVRIRRPIPRTKRKLVSIRPAEVKVPDRKTSKPKPISSPPKTTQKTTPAAPLVATKPSGGGAGKLTSEEEKYLKMLQERIEENWRAYLPEESGVLGEVRIRIAPDGRISEFTFLKGSGKAHVDASITRAIKKTILPPPPKSLAGQAWVLRFWPSGP